MTYLIYRVLQNNEMKTSMSIIFLALNVTDFVSIACAAIKVYPHEKRPLCAGFGSITFEDANQTSS